MDKVCRNIIVESREISYILERKNVKNVNLRIRKDGSVYVSASRMVPCEEIDKFIRSKGTYVLNAIDRFHDLAQHEPLPKQYASGETFYIQGRQLRLQVSQAKKDAVSSDGVYIFLEVKDENDVEKKRRLVTRFLDEQCKTVFSEILDELYPLFEKYGVEKPALRIRDMKTCWGTCLTKKCIITLNKRLLAAPRNCIEYVVMHELCHLIHPNHSKHFYELLSALMPDWKERKQLLAKTV